MKRRDISYNRCYQILYFRGRRNIFNMLRSLKQKHRKVWTSSHKIYQVGVRYQNVMELCLPLLLDASGQRDSCGCSGPHHFPIFISPRLSLAYISLQYKLFGTRSRPMDTQSAITCFSKKIFTVSTHWKRLFLFTLSRLMKRPKTFCDPARDEHSQLAFFREIYRKRFYNF